MLERGLHTLPSGIGSRLFPRRPWSVAKACLKLLHLNQQLRDWRRSDILQVGILHTVVDSCLDRTK